MDPETNKLLEKIFELTKENNAMLHKIRGVQKRVALYNLLKFLIILGIVFGIFYYIKPYLTKMMDFIVSLGVINKGLNNEFLMENILKF